MKIKILFIETRSAQFQVLDGRRGAVTHGTTGRDWSVEILDAKTAPGAPATRVTVKAGPAHFTFFLRDVSAAWPIWIPQYGAAVTTDADVRSYEQIAEDLRQRGLQNELDQMAASPEDSFAAAAAATREQICETWLGLGRDMRIFRVNFETQMGYLGVFQAQQSGYGGGFWGKRDLAGPECELFVGRGSGVRVDVRRWLDDGVLPILNAEQRDCGMVYRMSAFATLERSALTAPNIRGTHYLVADSLCVGHMHLPAEEKFVKDNLAAEIDGNGEQTVLLIRVEAINSGSTPHYAFLSAMIPRNRTGWTYDGTRGWGMVEGGKVSSLTRLNGQPLPQSEVSVLVAPGEKVTLEVAMPHGFISAERAAALMSFDFEQRRAECRQYWQAKLAAAASIHVPEKRIDEMIRAGLLHLDLVTYGLEPDGPLAATIGLYSPIGSESSPIIQFYDSIGCHRLAERSLEFFLAKQHENGFMQNFGGYMLETGGVLWSMGEHHRYTRDDVWLRRVQPNVSKACEYLLAWRERNKRPELADKGYGLIEGKCADPDDQFRQFMLNGFAYLGLQRASEMLTSINPSESKRLAAEAAAWREDIRTTLQLVMGESPVVPLGDGSWAPTCPAWAESRGPTALHVDGTAHNSHRSVACKDSLIGPLYLILQEVVDARELAGEFLLKTHHELFTQDNVGFSQPYYCRHDYAHLRRGEPAAFLKNYYRQIAAMADRQTYTFWEHLFTGGPHKTHEEAWFLMETRWMLWIEDGAALRLLSAVPRAWLENGKQIQLDKVVSYFGRLSLTVTSHVDTSRIEAAVEFHESARKPAQVLLRLPHPLGLKARNCTGGTYDAATETVTLTGGKVILEF